MRTPGRPVHAGLLLALAVAGCKLFDDPSPQDISVRLTGDAVVEIILSKRFVAGVDEAGTTQVQVFVADTLYRTLPVDTVIDVEVDRRLFVQVTPQGVDRASVGTRVDVDDRTVVNDAGDIFTSNPWRYVYLFNQQVTRIVNVVF
jgi:hypothetical protein